jgi:hypothetical protein
MLIIFSLTAIRDDGEGNFRGGQPDCRNLRIPGITLFTSPLLFDVANQYAVDAFGREPYAWSSIPAFASSNMFVSASGQFLK